MSSNTVFSKPNWFIWCMPKDDGFMMIGSRKINHLQLEAIQEYEEFWGKEFGSVIPFPRSYSINASFDGFIVVVGQTEFEAFTSLMHALRQEEIKEQEERTRIQAQIEEERQRRAEEITESDWGDYDDWDYYDDDIY